jgi:hypothetical protein
MVKAFSERRVHPRMRARWPVTILTDGGPVKGETINIAATGAYIQCEGPVRRNEAYKMVIGLGDKSVALNGKVLWSHGNIRSGNRDVTRIGVSFCD